MQYTLPRNLYDELVKKVGKESAEKLASAINYFWILCKKKLQKK